MFITATEGYPVIPLSKRHRWSPEMLSFVEACLLSDPDQRWTTAKYVRAVCTLTFFRLKNHKWLKKLPRKREMVELFKSFHKVSELSTIAAEVTPTPDPAATAGTVTVSLTPKKSATPRPSEEVDSSGKH